MVKGEATVQVRVELEELRGAIREAHGVLRDLRTERRAVQKLIAGIGDRVDGAITDRIEKAVREQIEMLGRATEKAMSDAVAKVGREFDRLAAIYLGQDHPSGESLEQLTRQAAAQRMFKP